MIQRFLNVEAESLWRASPVATSALNVFFKDYDIQQAFFYGYECLTAFHFDSMNVARKIILLGDPYHLVAWERVRNIWADWSVNRRFSLGRLKINVRQSLHELRNSLRWRGMSRKVKHFDWGYATAAHHADYYARFNSAVTYRPSPVLGPGNANVQVMMKSRSASQDLNFLYIGHNLGGTSNSAGMQSLMQLLSAAVTVEVRNRPWKIFVAGGDQHVEGGRLEFFPPGQTSGLARASRFGASDAASPRAFKYGVTSPRESNEDRLLLCLRRAHADA